ncbi:non-ribosomal peptide synthase/polyketide synthase [Xanthomonas prunicola]|uniref:non-ribosomal peptide synthase/polyketide synthase n=1 Tax=Xanthomonas prunicola TaxID=2053930 RepID=UPI0021B1FD9B|nr:non-ribosomal peptide synthase/polyketide synthase [Xanthomonas prunicola]UXA57321.1 non-ribosomal peptide synthase/polyketide synthase [Xanthomonas prunicola]
MQLSYAQLDAHANRLAHRLIAAGVRPDTRVALYLSRGAERLVALLAVFKAGGAYVPLDPDQPTERVAFMLGDARVRVVLTDTQLQQQLPASRALQQTRVLLLDAPTSAADPAHHHAPVIDGLHPDHLAYVVYTSGSTGQPKGVMVSHRGLVNLALAQIAAFGVQPHSRVLQLASIGFDACVSELLMAWLAGACLHVPPAEALAGAALLEVLQHQRITHLTVTPTVLASLPEQVSCPSLQTLVLAGEAADAKLARRWQAHTRVINAYGPTEASVCASLHLDGVRHGERLPIGRPMANVRLYVLDPQGHLAPIGVRGQLHIAGRSVARGYLRRPDLTAERFVPDPFAEQPGQRMYKTGDLARWTADGNLESLGRNDDQIKLRGVRIELAEIESALRSCAGVRDAAVLLRHDRTSEPRLVAYVVGDADAVPEAQSLRTHLGGRLPEVMLPAAYVQLDALPLTPNGKLDRRALPAPDADALATHTYVAPEGELEVLLAALWSDLLGVEQVSRHASFFALGGHSLLAIKLIERLRQHGWALQVRALFGATTLADLAAALRPSGAIEVPPNRITVDCTRITPELLPLVQLTQDEIDAAVATVDGGAANVQDIYPLTALQEGLLFHHRASSLGDAYLSFSVLAFDTRAQLDAFIAALEAVIARHDILRTGFAWQGLSAPVQIVWRHAVLSLHEHRIDAPDVLAALKIRIDPSTTQFDVTQAPLIRGHLVEDPHQARWLLGLQTHHLVIDHTTLELLVEEIQFYLGDRAEQLPIALPFRDFVAQARLGASHDQHRAFFTRQLGDLDTPTTPFGLRDVHGTGADIEQAVLPLSAALCAAARLQTRRLDVSPASLFHLAYALVLAQASGQDDVVFGTTLFGRMHAGAGADRALGMFLNTLPIRLQRDRSTVADAVRHTQARLAELLHHEHASLALAQRCSGIAPPAPLFTALFNYRHTGGGSVQTPSIETPHDEWRGVEMVEAQERTNYPLTLSVDDIRADGGFALVVKVNQRIGAARVAAMMLQAVQALVQALEQAPQTALHNLDLLPPDERARLDGFTATAVAPHETDCLHQLFQAQVGRTPHAIALLADGRELSYAALEAHANQLAHQLHRLGVGPEHRVALHLPRSPVLVVALLATLKAGAAYLPLDPELPDARLAFLLKDSGACMVLTCAQLHDRLPARDTMPDIGVLRLDALPTPCTADPGAPRVPGLCPDNLAYVIYTSGSTGHPKGTLLTHRAAAHYLQWAAETYRPHPSALVSSSLAFDATLTSVMAPLLCGATVELLPEHDTLDALRQRLCDPTPLGLVKLTPAHLEVLGQRLADHPEPLSPAVMVIGGEALPVATLARWQTLAPRTRLINQYGPTEAAIACVMHEATAADAVSNNDSVSIGRPIAHMRIYLLDQRDRRVPIGITGHLLIAGVQLARGYLGRPDLTAERFVPDPFAEQPGQRMYRSGDLACWRDNGTLDFLGRNDDQVKLRGFRIEPGEIAAVLRTCPGVHDATVLLRQDSPGEPRLVAYLVTAHPDDADPLALRHALAMRLPDVMLPTAYMRLDTLPLTANGKRDRRALPAPEQRHLGQSAHVPPQGELERTLAQLWSELLEVDRIGRHDSFFALGGHSLLAVRLISRIRSVLGLELPLATLFASPRLADLAVTLGSSAASSLPAIVSANRAAPLPLSFAQQRLWFLAQFDAQADLAYLIPRSMRLRGRLDRQALRQALDRIVDRHDTLRTRIVVHQNEPVQQIDPVGIGFALCEHDLSADPDPIAQATRYTELEAQTPFDLTQDTLARGQLLHLGEDDHVLLVTLHHLVCDGWSMRLLERELSTLYAAFVSGQPDPLPPLQLHYADVAVWQRRWLVGEVLQRQRAFWLEHLRDAPALLELPTDRPRPALQDYRGDAVEFAIPAELTAALKALSQRHGTTVFMTVLAAWSVLLSRLSGQPQAVVGTPIANRTRSELEPLIGLFVNTQALHIDLRANPSVAALLAAVRRTALAAQEHQDLPFEQVIEALNPVRSLAATPLFQSMLIWQNTADADLTLSGLDLQPIQAQGNQAKFDLELSLHERHDRIVGHLGYATALFDRHTIERQLAQFIHVLAGMAADDKAAVAQLPLLPPDERALIGRFSVTEGTPCAPAICIHHLFEAQVRRTPDAIAVSEGARAVRYAELEARANRVAHRLRNSGVDLESRVALYLPRSIDQIVALLATLKAGAAYLPLDPELPDARLAFLLADSRPCAVLTCTALHSQRQSLGSAMQDVTLLMLDTELDTDADRHDPGAPTVPGLCPDNLAYVIYTSGSTGQPKGTLLTHAGAAHYLQWAIETYRPFPSAVVSSSLAFDATLTSLLAPLLCGAHVELLPEHATLDALRRRLCEPTALGLVKLTPAHLEVLGQQLLDHTEQLSPAVMVIGGEALPAATLARWQTLAPNTRLINEYGPTETAVGCVVHEASTADAHAAHGRVPIGRPIDHLRIHVLDQYTQLAPIGVTGHLHIAGPQLARGYLGRPDLTAERFVPDPFAEQPGQRMYRSGDLACWHADGTLDYLGRNDDQIKLRGFRIELGEIGAALRACNGVQDAAVVLREDTPGEPRLVAYLVGDADTSADALRTQLATRLPEVMLPSAYVHLQALPLTANGKLDRRALPAPDADAFAAQAYAPPEGALETLLARLWSELLGVERVGRHDTFFALGGHSLLAVRLISRIRSSLGIELPLATLFAHPRLADLAQALDSAAASTLPAIVPAERGQPLPLSFAQQRLWFLAQLDAQADLAYLMPNGLRLRGRLDRHALRQALDRLVARHETLRTRIGLQQEEPVQLIDAEDVGFPLREHDLSGHPDPETEVSRLAEHETGTPFDLARDTLARGQLLRLGEDEHVLLVTLHHLVADGWSMGVLVHELGTLYAAFAQGRPDPLPPLPIQYTDYSLWQRRWLEGPLLQRQLDFWRDHLQDAPALLELPTDRPRPARQDARGDTLACVLDAALSTALTALSQRHGTTVFMTLLAAWGVLLARLSGQEQVVIGTPIANRTRSELEPLIGLFVNTQALCIDLRGQPSFGDLLGQVRTTALAAQAHQDVPFEQVIEALNPTRDLAHHPVFQVMFAWQNTPDSSIELPDLALHGVPQRLNAIKFDLDLALQARDRAIVGSLGYATALFDAATIQRWWRSFEQLLHALTRSETTCVWQLDWLDAPQRQHLLAAFGTGATAAALDQPVHRLFEAQAQRTPDAIAAVADEQCVSYAALDARANQMAHHLVALGVVPESVVAVCLPRGIDLIVALLAILKAGAAYLPLDINAPPARLDEMLVAARTQVLLAQRQIAVQLVPRKELQRVLTDADAALWASAPVHAPSAATWHPQHPAYVIYTSGSTGQAKGVVISHQALVNFLAALHTQLPLSPQDRLLAVTTICFDIAALELFAPLIHGACVVIAAAQIQEPTQWMQLLAEHRISVLQATPTFWQMLLNAGWQSAPTLRLLCGGEALPQDLAQRLRAGGGRLWNLYGPTETTIWASAYPVLDTEPGNLVSLGRPLSNTRMQVLDTHRQLLPLGVAGELYIAGPQLARGYLGRPDLTAERFVPDPFAEQPGQRMYRSGDLARWRADGNLQYLGRNDDQIKLRGFRIEPGEIEAVLRGCDGVREAAVVLRTHGDDKRLFAYLVGDAVLSAERLRAALAMRLPDYMIPAAYVQLDTLPLTPNGKLDRRALPAPDADALAVQEYAPPAGELETLLATLWSELLGVERVGRHDTFFALGGHSLLAVRLISRIRSSLGIELPLATLFAQPCLTDLAQSLHGAAASTLPAIVPADRSAPLPLSFAQQRLWFLAQLDVHADLAYLMPNGLRLRGKLDRHALRQALDRIVARHETLRTRIGLHQDEPVQLIGADSVGFPLIEHDVSGHPDPEAELLRLAECETSTPFDLAHDSLARGQLLRLGDDHHVLLITLHHLICDGWSMGLLVQELNTLYAAFVQHHPDPLPPLPLQYADIAVWQRRWIDGEVLQRQRDFWMEHLHDAPALLELPCDRPRPLLQDHRGEAMALALNAQLSASLKILSQRHGTTVFMTLLAAWGALLARLSGQEQVVIGTPIANRTRSELEPLIGLFVNTQALCIDLRTDPSVAELLAQVRATALAAQAHQDIPFEQVIEAINPARNLAHRPVFQAMFTWQNASISEPDLALPGLQLQSLAQPLSALKFDLDLALEERDGCIVGSLGYATALFDATTIQRWWRGFVQVLRALTRDDTARVSQLPWLDAPQREQLLADFGTGDMATVSEQPLHRLFEAQARQTPDAIAVVSEQRGLRYAALDAQANRLAQRLRSVGLRAGQRVAIALPRSVELIIAQLAVLKCGAAYVPLDVDHPDERLLALIDDAQMSVLIHAADSALAPAQVVCLTIGELDIYGKGDAEGDGDDIATPPAIAVPATAAAYVMYTSGSTGTPKGVTVSHGAVANLVLQDGPARLRFDDRVAFASNPAFDSATLEVWGSLLHGATVVVVPAPVMRDPHALGTLVARERLSVLILVAGVLRAYAPAIAPQLGTLRLLLTGGDVADPHALTTVFEAGGATTVLQTYGPTESTQFVTALALQHAPDATRRLPIGRPLANTRLYVLDRHGQPVPIGVTGELHLAGAQLAQGYLHRPALTAERFVPDPFAEQPGERMYKTGDLACWLADGTLDFLGRNDAQVKIRGFRIEPGEIEAALRSCAGVQVAVVIARNDTGEKRLVAYVIADQKAAPVEPASLRTQLAAHLPDHMLPAAYVQLDALPLTPNGKLDRAALPAPDDQALDLHAYVAPQGELEQVVATLWSELLGVAQVGRRDDFFALGGHSLLAVQLVSRLRQQLDVELPLAEVFSHPQMAQLASRLASAAPQTLPPIVPVPRDRPLPLSFAQQRLWFVAQLDPQAHLAYLMPLRIRLRGPLHGTALRRALDHLVARHEPLRTRIGVIDGSAVQQIATADIGFALTDIDLSRHAEHDEAIQRHAEQETTTPFDGADRTLVRGRLLRLADADHVLLLTVHHLVADGWSMGVLVHELGTLYAAFVQGRPDPLAPLPIQYADVAVWQRSCLGEEALQDQRRFWVDHLHAAPSVLELPTDRPRAAQQDYRGDSLQIALDPALTAALTDLGQRHGSTLFMTLLAAWGALLGRLSGQDQVVIGTPIANRTRNELEPLIGLFVNTQALRIDLRGTPSFADLLGQVRATALAAQAHQDLPFEQVIEALNPARDLAHHPVFQAMFAWQNAPTPTPALPGLTVQPIVVAESSIKFDLQLTLQVHEDRIVGGLSYATALFDRSTVERHLAQFVMLLQGMVANDRACVAHLPLLADDEQAQLQGFNATATDLGGAGYLHRAIEAQAQRTPDAIAVTDDHGTLSYAELDARSNQLAHHLIGLGVVPESSVAVCLPRSIDLVVALLAILKAGAAYLPLDVDAPPARLDGMLADAKPCALLAHRLTAALLTPRDDLHTLLLDAEPAAWTSAPAHVPIVTALHPQHPAYVIYTSGSTGKPKGVINTHASIDNRLQWMQQALQLQPEQRVLQKTPVGFDVSVWELFWPLRVGARLVLAEPGGHKDPAYLIDLIEQARIDTVHFVPSMLRAFLEALPDGACASLRRIVCSGEALPVDLASTARQRLPQARLYNLYGPTEAAVDVSVWECTEADTQRADRPTDRQYAIARARCTAATLAHRRVRRTADRRRAAGARLSGSPGPDRRTLRPRSVRRPARPAHVPHGRCIPLACRRRAGVPRPQ